MVLFGIFIFLLICNRAMLVQDNHDEHQFMASGYLLATRGLLPYRDFAYFHMPNLVFIYALLEKISVYRLLTVRIFSAIFGTLTVMTVTLSTFFLLQRELVRVRIASALSAGLFLAANPIFAGTSGLAWNHDLPVFLALAAAIVLYRSKDHPKPFVAVAISGMLISLSIGTRLSFATLIPAFVLACAIHPAAKKQSGFWKLLLALTIGGAIGMIPSIVLFAIAPGNFIFGNLIYARLNTLYRLETGYDDRMSLLLKLQYLAGSVLPDGNNLLVLVVLIVMLLIPAWTKYRESKSWEFETSFWALLALFGLVGSFLPTPSFEQYFYAPIPLIILGAIFNLPRLSGVPSSGRNVFSQFIIATILISTLLGLKDANLIGNTFQAQKKWFPYILHWRVEKLEPGAFSQGPVLTLNPFYAIESRRAIYPEFAPGLFAYRVAQLVNEPERKQYKLVAPADLEGYLAQNPPGAVLIGRDPELESEMEQYAINHGYKKVGFPGPFTLWIVP
jgi:4-amino-4-deoxy-L-arabinose transferase-like glycosyltransferase